MPGERIWKSRGMLCFPPYVAAITSNDLIAILSKPLACYPNL